MTEELNFKCPIILSFDPDIIIVSGIELHEELTLDQYDIETMLLDYLQEASQCPTN